MTELQEYRYRFIGRWRLFFDYSAPLIFRYRIKTAQYYSEIAASTDVTRLYRDEIGYEARHLQARFSAVTAAEEMELSPDRPEKAAHEIAWKLKSFGHSDQFLFHRWNNFWPLDTPSGEEAPFCFTVRCTESGLLKFPISSWMDKNAPGGYRVYFIVNAWKNYPSGLHMPVLKLRYVEMDAKILEFLRSKQVEGLFPGLALPVGEKEGEIIPTRVLRVEVFATDANDAVDKALRFFHISKDIFNVVWERSNLNPIVDFDETAVLERAGHVFTFRWRQRRNNLRRISRDYLGNATRRRAEQLALGSRDFSDGMSAYADALDAIASLDNSSALRALCTGLENLVGPVREYILERLAGRKVSRIPQLKLMKIFAKVISVDYARDLFADFIGDVNSKLRKGGGDELKVRDNVGVFKNRKLTQQYLYGHFADQAYLFWPYVRMLSYLQSSYRSFLISVSTRFYMDYVHAIVIRNSIVHGNRDLSDEYTLGLLGHTFKTLMTIRMCGVIEDRGEKAVEVSLTGSNQIYVQSVMILLYEFNWFTGIVDNQRYPSSSAGRELEALFLRGHLDWHGRSFEAEVRKIFSSLEVHITSAIEEYGEGFFFDMKRADGLLS